MKVEGKWVFIICLFFSSLFYAQSWSRQMWLNNQGPDLLAQDQQGNLYIKIKSIILRYGPNGEFLDQRDLKTIGVEKLTGGIGFFPNGDLLMVPTSYKPSFLENVLIDLRMTLFLSSEPSTAKGSLSRCNWGSLECKPLAEFKHSFVSAFWLDIDENENIFLADTSKHKIYWLDESGRELDSIVHLKKIEFFNQTEQRAYLIEDPKNIKFPNQIKKNGDFLWVANANGHSIIKIALSFKEHKFNKDIESYAVNSSRLPETDRWPAGLAIVDKDYFVLSQGDNMAHGTVYRANEKGEIEDVFSKNGESDFFTLTFFNHEVLVADLETISVHRYTKSGNFIGDFDSPELLHITAPLKLVRDKYRNLMNVFKVLFWIFLVAGFAIAIVLEKRSKQNYS